MKTQKMSLTLYVVILLTLASSSALAAAFPRILVSARYHNYFGETGLSFSEQGTGFGGGVNFLFDYYPRFAPFIGAYYGVIDGKQSFYDDGVLTPSSFILQSVSLEPGINFYPIERGTAGLNYFISAAGIVAHQSLGLSKTLTFQRLPRSGSGYSTGGRLGIGMDWNLKNTSFSSKRKWAITTEIMYRKESTVLVDQNFTLDNIALALGFSW